MKVHGRTKQTKYSTKQRTPLKWAKNMNRPSSREDTQMPKWCAERCSASSGTGKRESEPQGDVTSRVLEPPFSKTRKAGGAWWCSRLRLGVRRSTPASGSALSVEGA